MNSSGIPILRRRPLSPVMLDDGRPRTFESLRSPLFQDLCAAGLLVAAALLIVCLAGANPGDPSLFHYVSGRAVENPLGWLGATIAELLTQLIGHGAFFIPAGFVLEGVALCFRGRPLFHARMIAGSVLLILIWAVILNELMPANLIDEDIAPGGYLGLRLAEAMRAVLGGTGLWLTVLTSALASYVLLSGRGPVEFARLTWLVSRQAGGALLTVMGVLGPKGEWPAAKPAEDPKSGEEFSGIGRMVRPAAPEQPGDLRLGRRPVNLARSAETEIPAQTTPDGSERRPVPIPQRSETPLEVGSRRILNPTVPRSPLEGALGDRPVVRPRANVEPGTQSSLFGVEPPPAPSPIYRNTPPPAAQPAQVPEPPRSVPPPPLPTAASAPPAGRKLDTEKLFTGWPFTDDNVPKFGHPMDIGGKVAAAVPEPESAPEPAADPLRERIVAALPEPFERTPLPASGVIRFRPATPASPAPVVAPPAAEGASPPAAVPEAAASVHAKPTIRPRVGSSSYDEFLRRAIEDAESTVAEIVPDEDDEDGDLDEVLEDTSEVPDEEEEDAPETIGLKEEAVAPLVLPSEWAEEDALSRLPLGRASLDLLNHSVQRQLAQAEIMLPTAALLNEVPESLGGEPEEVLVERAATLEAKLRDFKIEGIVEEIVPGPVITRYEYVPAPGVKVSKITSLTDDLSMALRCQAPPRIAIIPGKSALGIEIPNQRREMVSFTEIVRSREFLQASSPLTLAIGKDTEGRAFVTDLAAMPHLLVAGTTGSGKSVCVNTILMSLIMFRSPLEVQLILVDPKMLELSIYNDIPHLRAPVVTDPAKAATALQWAVNEMEERYARLSGEGVRNIKQFNQFIRDQAARERWSQAEIRENMLPYLVIVIDELADLMVVASNEVETSLMRLAQMARAAGIHLILATQRPSVDVITGVIKANFPSRLAFRVSQKVDSRTILDEMGADTLLGNGDMLLRPPGTSRIIRLHGAYISEEEINRVVDFWKEQQLPNFQGIFEDIEAGDEDGGEDGLVQAVNDEFFIRAVELVIASGHASISMLQRRFRVGYARAARLVDMMERNGIVGKFEGAKPREVLVDMAFVAKLKKMSG